MASNEPVINLKSRPEQREMVENTSSSPALAMNEGTASSSKSAAAAAGLIQRMQDLSVSPPRQRDTCRTPLSTIDASSPSGGRRGPNSNSKTPPRSVGNSPLAERDLRLPPQHQQQQPVTRHFDLTPVTRNTFGADDDLCMVVTPDDQGLVGEHLAMPDNLDKEEGPALPPLPNHRAKSLGHLDLLPSKMTRASNLSKTTTLESTLEPTIMEPIAFPSERKCFTFTSRQQYEDQYLAPTSEGGAPPAYQPTRQELMDVGLAEDEVERIFTTRRVSLTPDYLATIPLGDRQWSIPSIRMANELNGSIASHTSYTDDEDYLLGSRDDDTISLSSRGSLYLPDAMELGAGEPLGGISSVFMPSVTLNGIDLLDDQRRQLVDPSSENDFTTINARDGDARDRRIEKRSRKDEKALQWLRTVEASDDVFAEAASSKFLTQTPKASNAAAAASAKTNNHTAGFLSMAHDDDPSLSANRIIRRQTSSPPTLH